MSNEFGVLRTSGGTAVRAAYEWEIIDSGRSAAGRHAVVRVAQYTLSQHPILESMGWKPHGGGATPVLRREHRIHYRATHTGYAGPVGWCAAIPAGIPDGLLRVIRPALGRPT